LPRLLAVGIERHTLVDRHEGMLYTRGRWASLTVEKGDSLVTRLGSTKNVAKRTCSQEEKATESQKSRTRRRNWQEEGGRNWIGVRSVGVDTMSQAETGVSIQLRSCLKMPSKPWIKERTKQEEERK
jgi:hypothetical protein